MTRNRKLLWVAFVALLGGLAAIAVDRFTIGDLGGLAGGMGPAHAVAVAERWGAKVTWDDGPTGPVARIGPAVTPLGWIQDGALTFRKGLLVQARLRQGEDAIRALVRRLGAPTLHVDGQWIWVDLPRYIVVHSMPGPGGRTTEITFHKARMRADESRQEGY